MGRGQIANAIFHRGHEDFVLLLPQIEKHFLSFDEVGHALPGDFTEKSGGRVVRVGQLLPQSVHDVRILPHGKIQKDPLCGKEALHALLGPAR